MRCRVQRPNQLRPPARSGTRRGNRPRKGTPKPTDPVCRLAQQNSASRTNHAAQPARLPPRTRRSNTPHRRRRLSQH
eukprot:6217361-Amphidinium_carterae.1